MKFFYLYLMIACSGLLMADILYLKTGEELEGAYIETSTKGIAFETEFGIGQYPINNVQKLDLGYSGVSFCLLLTNKQKDCEGVLIQVSDTGIKFGKGKGLRRKESISFKKILRLEVRRLRKNERLVGIFSEGLPVEVEIEGKKIKGQIEANNRKEKTLGIRTESQSLVLPEEEIISIVWQKKPNFFDYSLTGLELLIPGIQEYKKNRWLGLGIGVTFLALSASIPMQYRASQDAIAENVDYIPVGRDIWIVSGADSNPAYEQSIRNYYGAIAGIGALYGFHGIYMLNQYNKGQFPAWKPVEITLSRPSIYTWTGVGQGANIELKFSYSF